MIFEKSTTSGKRRFRGMVLEAAYLSFEFREISKRKFDTNEKKENVYKKYIVKKSKEVYGRLRKKYDWVCVNLDYDLLIIKNNIQKDCELIINEEWLKEVVAAFEDGIKNYNDFIHYWGLDLIEESKVGSGANWYDAKFIRYMKPLGNGYKTRDVYVDIKTGIVGNYQSIKNSKEKTLIYYNIDSGVWYNQNGTILNSYYAEGDEYYYEEY